MPGVSVKNGNFQILLQGADDNDAQIETAVEDLDYAYVEIKVGAEPPMVPRQPLLRSPFVSPNKIIGKTDVLIQSDSENAGAGDIFIKAGSNAGITVLNNGNVGIGNTNPQEKFSVEGVVESKSGGFKFPNGSTQSVGLNSCVFRLKPISGRGGWTDGESGWCTFDPDSITCEVFWVCCA